MFFPLCEVRVKHSIRSLLSWENDAFAVHFFLSLCLERSASFLVASGQRPAGGAPSSLKFWGCFGLNSYCTYRLGFTYFPSHIYTLHFFWLCFSAVTISLSLSSVQFWELQWTGRLLALLPVHTVCCWKALELEKTRYHIILHEPMPIAFNSNGFKGHPSNANWICMTPAQWIGSHWKDFDTKIICIVAELKAAVRNESNILQDTVQIQNKKMVPAWKIYIIKLSPGFMLSPDVTVGMCFVHQLCHRKKCCT